MMDRFLKGRRILVLEDDYFAALDLQQVIEDLGGIVIGPVGQLEKAQDLARAQAFEGAILDIRLDGRTSYPLARELMGRGVAVVFLTGFEPDLIEPEFRDVPHIAKPYDPRRGEPVLRRVLT
jgi:CheY-like chemotaxis protein